MTDHTSARDRVAHTPGEWVAMRGIAEGDEHRCGVFAVRDGVHYHLATVENGAPGDTCDTEWENAKIMAAANMMFDRLQSIEMLLTEEIVARGLVDGSELHSLLSVPRNIARDAIVKALSPSNGGSGE